MPNCASLLLLLLLQVHATVVTAKLRLAWLVLICEVGVAVLAEGARILMLQQKLVQVEVCATGLLLLLPCEILLVLV